MSPRRDIRLTSEEEAFLREATKAALATVDGDGFPHVVATGLVACDRAIHMTSYAKAHKVLNAEKRAGAGAEPGALASAPKRVVFEITPEKIASWDHRKLGGRY